MSGLFVRAAGGRRGCRLPVRIGCPAATPGRTGPVGSGFMMFTAGIDAADGNRC